MKRTREEIDAEHFRQKEERDKHVVKVNTVCMDTAMEPSLRGFIHPSKQLKVNIYDYNLVVSRYVYHQTQCKFRPPGEWVMQYRKSLHLATTEELKAILDKHVNEINSN